MPTILDRANPEDVISDPFPHLVIPNALPLDLADRLLAAYPSVEYLGSGRQGLVKNGVVPNNQKIRYFSSDILNDTKLASEWRLFTQAHLTPSFFKKYLSLFGEHIYRVYPELKERFASLSEGDVGVRHQDSFENKKLLIDAEMCADTPVLKTSSVKIAHLDNPNKLGVVILYLRKKDDDSQGGSFQVHRLHAPTFELDPHRLVEEKLLTKVREVPYEHNTAVVFLNTLHSFHGVAPRLATPHVRYSFDIAFELPKPLFDITPYGKRSLMSRARSYAKRMLRPGKLRV